MTIRQLLSHAWRRVRGDRAAEPATPLNGCGHTKHCLIEETTGILHRVGWNAEHHEWQACPEGGEPGE